MESGSSLREKRDKKRADNKAEAHRKLAHFVRGGDHYRSVPNAKPFLREGSIKIETVHSNQQ